MPKKEIEKNEYSLPKWSFLRFLLINWRIWITLGIIIYGFFYIGKALHEDKFFGETVIKDEYKELKIIQKRSNPNTSILTNNPYDSQRFYEIDLGLSCVLKPDLLGKSFNLQVQLIQRNYNNTYYLKFPTIKTVICEKHNTLSNIKNKFNDESTVNPQELEEEKQDLNILNSEKNEELVIIDNLTKK